jgi:hypothetical protein
VCGCGAGGGRARCEPCAGRPALDRSYAPSVPGASCRRAVAAFKFQEPAAAAQPEPPPPPAEARSLLASHGGVELNIRVMMFKFFSPAVTVTDSRVLPVQFRATPDRTPGRTRSLRVGLIG